MISKHVMPFGAEVLSDSSVRFRLWAPNAQQVAVCLDDDCGLYPLGPLENGWFETILPQARTGTLYRFQIEGKTEVPDPASRFQPRDVHGPSEVVDPSAFQWNDQVWRGLPWEETVLYELHVGAFTPEGTFRAAEQKLDYLRDLGITAIEVMPVADFPGARNWGYDGVLPFAPDSSYGRPDDLKRLIQAAHSKGLMVFLDVVYNHFGPEGNYLHLYAPQFFTNRHRTPWGDGINFDGPQSTIVRDFFIHNALYWLEEYHLDGLRLDAVHAIVDDSVPDFLTELAQTIRERLGAQRYVHLVVENVDNVACYLSHDSTGAARLYNAQWNDDIHHAMHVVLTGESDGYYADYSPDPMPHLCRCFSEGFAYQGEYSAFHGEKRGEHSAHLPPVAFVSFLQNHDQVGNRAFGERITQLAAPRSVKLAMEILLLAPEPPLLFMGEEFAASTPFLFFCDFHGDLAAAVTEGRRREFANFAKFSSHDAREAIPDPNAESTFLKSKLDWDVLHTKAHCDWLQFYRKLLTLRRDKIVPHFGRCAATRCDTVSGRKKMLSIDWIFNDGTTLRLRANFGDESFAVSLRDPGSLLYSSTVDAGVAFQQGSLPSCTVVWSLLS